MFIPNPIRLLDEKRDSIYYSSALFSSAYLYHCGVSATSSLGMFAFSTAARECARRMFWSTSAKKVAGVYNIQYSPEQIRRSTEAVTCAAGAVGYATLSSWLYSAHIFPQVPEAHNMMFWGTSLASFGFAGLAVSATYLAGGVKNIFRLYKNLLFDYPSKEDDGGHSETRRLIQGITSLFQPSHEVATAPVRIRRTSLSLT